MLYIRCAGQYRNGTRACQQQFLEVWHGRNGKKAEARYDQRETAFNQKEVRADSERFLKDVLDSVFKFLLNILSQDRKIWKRDNPLVLMTMIVVTGTRIGPWAGCMCTCVRKVSNKKENFIVK